MSMMAVRCRMMRLAAFSRAWTLVAAIAVCAMPAAVFAADGDAPKFVRVDFTSKPEQANVILNGDFRGETPLKINLTEGSYHVRFELKGYEPHDDFFKVRPTDQMIHRNVELEAEKGLLLITTEPEGCSLSLDGISFGLTPRLITTLDTRRTYRFNLQKAGYRSKVVEVRFNGREPLVKHEELILDSGSLHITSDPSGVSVIRNGILEGVTPLDCERIPKGRTVLEFSLDGYATQKRELMIDAGDKLDMHVEMVGKPGSLSLTSIPSGIRFYVNDRPYGKGPLTIPNLKAGRYQVRAEREGYESVTKTVFIGLGQSVSEEFKLESIMGRLEVRTTPPGAKVFVDGHLVGVTKGIPGGSDVVASETLAIENLERGEHLLEIKKPGYADAVRHPVIDNKRTTQTKVTMTKVFAPNFRIVTSTGTFNVFVDPSDNIGDTLNAETSMGVKRPFRRSDILEMKPLKSDD